MILLELEPAQVEVEVEEAAAAAAAAAVTDLFTGARVEGVALATGAGVACGAYGAGVACGAYGAGVDCGAIANVAAETDDSSTADAATVGAGVAVGGAVDAVMLLTAARFGAGVVKPLPKHSALDGAGVLPAIVVNPKDKDIDQTVVSMNRYESTNFFNFLIFPSKKMDKYVIFVQITNSASPHHHL